MTPAPPTPVLAYDQPLTFGEVRTDVESPDEVRVTFLSSPQGSVMAVVPFFAVSLMALAIIGAGVASVGVKPFMASGAGYALSLLPLAVVWTAYAAFTTSRRRRVTTLFATPYGLTVRHADGAATHLDVDQITDVAVERRPLRRAYSLTVRLHPPAGATVPPRPATPWVRPDAVVLVTRPRREPIVRAADAIRAALRADAPPRIELEDTGAHVV